MYSINREILFKTNIDDIQKLCSIDQKFLDICNQEDFWREYNLQYGLDPPFPLDLNPSMFFIQNFQEKTRKKTKSLLNDLKKVAKKGFSVYWEDPEGYADEDHYHHAKIEIVGDENISKLPKNIFQSPKNNIRWEEILEFIGNPPIHHNPKKTIFSITIYNRQCFDPEDHLELFIDKVLSFTIRPNCLELFDILTHILNSKVKVKITPDRDDLYEYFKKNK